MYFKKSPCIGICEMGSSQAPYCRGCMRDAEDLLVWKSLSPEEKKTRWLRVGKRRSCFPEASIIRDQLRRYVTIHAPVRRIVSVVPSLTQTLYDLGLGKYVVGVTAFCPPLSPSEGKHTPQVIGGTKRLNHQRIASLAPDFILANKEENTSADVERLAKDFPVWVSDVTSIDDALQLIWLLGEYLDCQERALVLVDRIREKLAGINPCKADSPPRFAYLIWRRPWMAAADETFISTWLERFGLVNCLKHRQRYPEVSLDELVSLKPELVFLPDEPYAFSPAEQDELARLLPDSRIVAVSGKYCSWYGSVMDEAIPYVQTLCTDVPLCYQPR